MKINEIIRERRLARRLTQEQVASYLGVTAPAVNKWEKGTSYPDITILPALARLLDTDLNTLLSFKEELTEQEIALFFNHLTELAETEGIERAYAAVSEKLREYPTCYPLLLNTALWLDGAVLLEKEEPAKACRATAEALYQRVLESPDPGIRNSARSVLISKYTARKEYEKAQELLDLLPEDTPVDKKQLQANLWIASGQFEEAAKLEEEKLLSAATEIQTTLTSLMELALKEHRNEDASAIADVSRRCAELFHLWDYTSYIAHFQLYSTCKDRTKCIETLHSMLKSLTHRWEPQNSPLYRHMKTRHAESDFGLKMRRMILQALREDPDMEFLQESEEFQEFLQKAEEDAG